MPLHMTTGFTVYCIFIVPTYILGNSTEINDNALI